MAEALIHTRRMLCAAVLMLGHAYAHAQSMQDPTRPAQFATGDGGQAASAGPQLQSVLIARQPGGRHLAVIDGDTVRLGDTWRGARVARITHDSVELVRGKERQVLTLPSYEEAGSVKPAARPR